MSEDIKEKLSAYLDDELHETQTRLLDQQLLTDEHLRSKLHRYALISETIKGNCNHCNAEGVAEAVHAALKQEPTIIAPASVRQKPASQWKTYVGGAAIAATVAALAVLNISSLSPEQGDLEQFPVTVEVSPTTALPFAAGLSQRASTKWTTAQSSSPEIEDELNRFLIDHSEYTTQSGVPGLLPYATFVVYDKQKKTPNE